MKLPALLAIGFAIVMGLGVYFLKNPAFLIYPAAWSVIGVAFWALNKTMKSASPTPQSSGEQASETTESSESSSESNEPAMTS